jgi:hypothetical protein
MLLAGIFAFLPSQIQPRLLNLRLHRPSFHPRFRLQQYLRPSGQPHYLTQKLELSQAI